MALFKRSCIPTLIMNEANIAFLSPENASVDCRPIRVGKHCSVC